MTGQGNEVPSGELCLICVVFMVSALAKLHQAGHLRFVRCVYI